MYINPLQSLSFVGTRFKILAADSLGVRSMATLVECCGARVLIDPSAALGPRRYGLPPHEVEELALRLALERIDRALEGADYVVFTHYHWDHYRPEAQLSEKTVYIKDPKNNINVSQRKRAALITKRKGLNLRVADGAKASDIDMEFSPALPHGPDGTKLGYVIGVRIGDLIFTSDVEGPVSDGATRWIIEMNPKVLIIDGPLTYMLGYRFSQESLDRAIENIMKIAEKTDVELIVAEHHLVRDLNAEKNFPVRERLKELGIRYGNAAEAQNIEPLLLEPWRRMLWKGEKEVSPNILRRVYDA